MSECFRANTKFALEAASRVAVNVENVAKHCRDLKHCSLEDLHLMSFRKLLLILSLSVGLAGMAFGAQEQTQSPKQDMKDAGHATKDAAKDTGRATKKTAKKTGRATKRATNKAARKTEHGAEKLDEKTKPNAGQPL